MFLDQRTLMQPMPLNTQLKQLLLTQLLDTPSAAAEGRCTPALLKGSTAQDGAEEAHPAAAAEPATAAAAETATAAAAAVVATAAGGDTPSDTQPPADFAAAAAAAAEDKLVWRQVYLGSSASSVCSSMTVGQLRHFFHDSALCIRSYDPSSGSVSLRLPAYLTPLAAAGGM